MTVLALALEFLGGLVLASLELAANLLFGALELFTGRCFLAAAGWVRCLETGMIVLIIGILLIARSIALFILLLWM